MSGQYITEHILAVRKDIAKLVTEKMTVKEAWLKLGHHDIGYNSFYQQCKLMIDLGYVQSFGFQKSGRAHCLIIKAIIHDYEDEQHNRVLSAPKGKRNEKDKSLSPAGVPRVFSPDDKHWYIEKKPWSKNYVSGSSLNLIN